MKPFKFLANRASGRRRASLLVTGGLVVTVSTALPAQTPPPVRGTMATEGTVKKVYAAANTVIVATIDGVEHVYHVTKDLVIHGGKGSGVDALRGLREGTTVVVHYTVDGGERSAQEIDSIGPDGLKTTEGVVTRVNRGRKEVTIRFDTGKTETFQLTDRAAADVGRDVDQAGKIIVYYTDEAGHKVAHYFKKKS